MIYSDSRYATGSLFKAHDARKNSFSFTVFRNFPYEATEYFNYTWTERDRIDLIANEFLGSADFWWVIMDFNPEVIDPFDIPLGSILRIPNV